MRHTGVMMIRPAIEADSAALRRLDSETLSSENSPAGPTTKPDDRPFFHENTAPDDVIVAVEGGTVVGYLKLESPPLCSPTVTFSRWVG